MPGKVQAVNVESALLLTQAFAPPRPLTPEDTAAVVAMLARDEAGALTGQTIASFLAHGRIQPAKASDV